MTQLKVVSQYLSEAKENNRNQNSQTSERYGNPEQEAGVVTPRSSSVVIHFNSLPQNSQNRMRKVRKTESSMRDATLTRKLLHQWSLAKETQTTKLISTFDHMSDTGCALSIEDFHHLATSSDRVIYSDGLEVMRSFQCNSTKLQRRTAKVGPH